MIGKAHGGVEYVFTVCSLKGFLGKYENKNERGVMEDRSTKEYSATYS